jgi:hypothetical protein
MDIYWLHSFETWNWIAVKTGKLQEIEVLRERTFRTGESILESAH